MALRCCSTAVAGSATVEFVRNGTPGASGCAATGAAQTQLRAIGQATRPDRPAASAPQKVGEGGSLDDGCRDSGSGRDQQVYLAEGALAVQDGARAQRLCLPAADRPWSVRQERMPHWDVTWCRYRHKIGTTYVDFQTMRRLQHTQRV